MSYELVELTDGQDYKPLELYKFTQFTQSWFYGQWQEHLGRKIKRFKLNDESGNAVCYFQAIPHSLPLKKSYLYIPFGPIFADKPTSVMIKAITIGLKAVYKDQDVVFARFDPDGDFGPLSSNNLGDWKSAPAFVGKEASFRPRGEMIVKLDNEDEVFKRFDKNTRYSARYGGKHGVTTRINSNLLSGLDDFYRLLSFTAKLQDFAIFEKDYYRNMLDICAKLNNAYFVEASKDGKVISSKLIIIYGEVAHSLLSGTDELGRKLRVPALVQWESMRQALIRGCTRYSIGGASSSEHDYPSIKRVTKYKQGFGGEITVHSSLYDAVFQSVAYHGYNAYKRARSFK